ncbi:nucleotidyltransferase [Halobacillus mangrovi]|uniref:tRNA(Met) cytidine acetate ligase n=1 Tax=Halobacillus mangrovi TaxID=402384 RepID=A0A1W5ZWG3_9BACI|nr:nucleotidyltransferase [Halobacillus mangrovi]ARI77587.1 hypothetical protein HM131_12355 [Halobacillus mangrovi]
MKACGVIVEYNPFHNGHRFHLEQSRQQSRADCLIAIMSGNFLQRGEPAIMDKWHRAEAALQSEADLVLELPYIYAVEHSDYFSQGAVQTLSEMGVEAICFGSESGEISQFLEAHEHLKRNEGLFNETVKKQLSEGLSFPEASRLGYKAIDLPAESIDLTQPNNILGYSYVKQILLYNDKIVPMTVKRTNSHYHDDTITGDIASATSIRKELLKDHCFTENASRSMPKDTKDQLSKYRERTHLWHEWERYFHFLQYKILTTPESELRKIHGVDEGLEHRLKRTIKRSATFDAFMEALKTKRYTWTRLQRTLVHILIGTGKEEASSLLRLPQPPYARVLGMNKIGREYLNTYKKQMQIPLITQPQQMEHSMLDLEERAATAYYSVLDAENRVDMLQREFGPPIRI